MCVCVYICMYVLLYFYEFLKFLSRSIFSNFLITSLCSYILDCSHVKLFLSIVVFFISRISTLIFFQTASSFLGRCCPCNFYFFLIYFFEHLKQTCFYLFLLVLACGFSCLLTFLALRKSSLSKSFKFLTESNLRLFSKDVSWFKIVKSLLWVALHSPLPVHGLAV